MQHLKDPACMEFDKKKTDKLWTEWDNNFINKRNFLS